MKPIRRAKTATDKDDSNPNQVVKVTSLGTTLEAHVELPYGLSANPPVGTDGLIVPVNNDSSDLAFLPYNGDTRTSGLKSGEVTVGNTTLGSQLAFNADGKIALGNTAGELFDELDKTLGQLQSATTATMMGPQPLDPATQAYLTNARGILALMKGVLL